MRSVRIPRWLDEAADWVSKRRWLSSVVAVSVFTVVCMLVIDLPVVGAAVLAWWAGLATTFAHRMDVLSRLRIQHDIDQLTIGGLRAYIAELEDRPVAEAQTKALQYVSDDMVAGTRTKPLPPVSDTDVEGGEQQ